jgi:2-iminobutanoate/2-iminopropanoate deaminase
VKEIFSEDAPKPIGPYSQGVATSSLLFLSGQIGADPSTGTLEEGIEAQTRRSLDNLAAVLRAEGLTLASVVKTTVFMSDLSQFAAMNAEYSKHFAPPFPARSTIQVAALPRGALVEIEAAATAGP